MVNKAIIVGRVGGDPEQRENGPVKFSVATNSRYKDKSGEPQEHTEWHNIEVWGKLGEICAQYLRKGKLVYIEGEIRTHSYEKDGETKYFTSIRASQMQMLGGKDE